MFIIQCVIGTLLLGSYLPHMLPLSFIFGVCGSASQCSVDGSVKDRTLVKTDWSIVSRLLMDDGVAGISIRCRTIWVL